MQLLVLRSRIVRRLLSTGRLPVLQRVAFSSFSDSTIDQTCRPVADDEPAGDTRRSFRRRQELSALEFDRGLNIQQLFPEIATSAGAVF